MTPAWTFSYMLPTSPSYTDYINNVDIHCTWGSSLQTDDLCFYCIRDLDSSWYLGLDLGETKKQCYISVTTSSCGKAIWYPSWYQITVEISMKLQKDSWMSVSKGWTLQLNSVLNRHLVTGCTGYLITKKDSEFLFRGGNSTRWKYVSNKEHILNKLFTCALTFGIYFTNYSTCFTFN